ncbi:iron ABC transporter ATP-binding protein [Campylobacter sp. MIT 99-7217]|uniref:iron ABC transporter ATP-binding protein n=1 Tax=Campylobacter sp. MIT 99-7217 TaxID=535091 RepID=UPI00115A3D94|nr:ATP-binding cassette domain-containing protein [Campylobacter sp. MIT 99-7217]TQR34521.1 iron ABC transporter ATP-binding protein [Campylobacter sp. MIT 99-7217]
MIRLQNICKNYEKTEVLKDISVSFQKGKFSSLIGANGAGKSTLLGIASRLIKPDSGQIYYDETELSHFKSNELAKKISILKQTNHLNIRLTVKELVSFGRFPHSANSLNAEDKIKINEAIEYMGLCELQDHFLDSLSGGQKQRAFIAMIIAQDTEYILLDEPLNNLDMKHCVSIMKILKKLIQDFNKGIICVLHDINFASVYSDEIVAMKDGKIFKKASTQELIQSELLKEIYDMDIKIKEVEGKKICIYFD